jgi:hypothetical protein
MQTQALPGKRNVCSFLPGKGSSRAGRTSSSSMIDTRDDGTMERKLIKDNNGGVMRLYFWVLSMNKKIPHPSRLTIVGSKRKNQAGNRKKIITHSRY